MPAGPARTAADTLHADEVLRTRAFLTMSSVLASVGALAALFLEGQPILRWTYVGMTAALLLANQLVLGRSRGARRLPQQTVYSVVALNVMTSFAAIAHYGFYSPAPMVLMLTITYFGLSGYRTAARWAFAGAVAVPGILMLGIALAGLDDPGLMSARGSSSVEQVAYALLAQAVYAACFVFASGIRRATAESVAGLEAALRQVAERDEQLAEAREQLELAVRAGAAGRLTGSVLGGWKLDEIIGRGGMGEIYVGERDGHRVAVKVLHPAFAENKHQFDLFMREARNTASLDTPHVVRVYDGGLTPEPYLATELLEGQDLRDILADRALSVAEAAQMATHVAAALDAAARAGIVHRDIKPSNIFHDARDPARPIWKVLDFGVSKAIGTDSTLGDGLVVGTPAYMAPESIELKQVRPRGDIFSLAAVVYRSVTGRRPFSGPDSRALMYAVLHEQPVAASRYVQVPDDVDLVLALGLAKSPEDRPGTAGEFAALFRAAIRGNLPAPIRDRARAVLRRHPWGATGAQDRVESVGDTEVTAVHG